MQTEMPAKPKGLMLWWAEMDEQERQYSRTLAEAAFKREVTPLEIMMFLITGHMFADPDRNIIDKRDDFRRFRTAAVPVPPS